MTFEEFKERSKEYERLCRENRDKPATIALLTLTYIQGNQKFLEQMQANCTKGEGNTSS